MHETILLVLPNLLFGNSSDFKPDTLPSGKAAIPVTEGSIAAVVVIAAVYKNFRFVKCIFIRFLFFMSTRDDYANVVHIPLGSNFLQINPVQEKASFLNSFRILI
jgi:hypothetical protein